MVLRLSLVRLRIARLARLEVGHAMLLIVRLSQGVDVVIDHRGGFERVRPPLRGLSVTDDILDGLHF